MALAGGSLYSTCVLRCCGAYFSLDAPPFTAAGLRFAAYLPCFWNLCISFSRTHWNWGPFSCETYRNLGPNQAY